MHAGKGVTLNRMSDLNNDELAGGKYWQKTVEHKPKVQFSIQHTQLMKGISRYTECVCIYGRKTESTLQCG